MSLSLRLPEKEAKLAGFVEVRPKALREWLAGLPNHNPLDAGRQVLDALASCNRVEVDAETRMKLLDEYQGTLALLYGGLEALYVSSGFPLRDKARQAALLTRSLWLELADGYKIALIERLEKRFAFGGGKLTPQLIHQVLAIYYRLYQVCSRVSMLMPPGVWREAHRLFRYAVENRLTDYALPDREGAPTTSMLYKRLLLLSLSDPLRFAPSELARVIDIIDKYAQFAHFQPVTSQSSAAGCFLVRLDEDEGAHYIGSRNVDDYQGMAMLVDTLELSKKLHRVLAGLEAKMPAAGDRAKLQLWLETVRRLIKQWSIAPRRVFQRISVEAPIELRHGLGATARSVHDGNPPFGNGHFGAAGLVGELPSMVWRIINESPGGYAITSREAPAEQLHAGDVVALRPQGGQGWMVAVIRWLQQCEDGALEMGLQVLSPRANAALLRPALVQSRYEAALMLPAIDSLRQPALIATTRGSYAPLREMLLLTGEGERVVRATKLVEQQSGYDLFEYTEL
ncbi:hypothetical protein N8I74_19080 [Chitiniphilus purpureus]|uniref:GTPase n=1 Tax=Chitiniphilus purpureus TaxID=2981137 RepID=A0ABY6DM13_9NEIS|nr:hypothetical protein [Chitiniphilus sp. CD1]UXY15387.1 hypothetical protein N8I74_19080 [Chitiniphilus sp. CD1]